MKQSRNEIKNRINNPNLYKSDSDKHNHTQTKQQSTNLISNYMIGNQQNQKKSSNNYNNDDLNILAQLKLIITIDVASIDDLFEKINQFWNLCFETGYDIYRSLVFHGTMWK